MKHRINETIGDGLEADFAREQGQIALNNKDYATAKRCFDIVLSTFPGDLYSILGKNIAEGALLFLDKKYNLALEKFFLIFNERLNLFDDYDPEMSYPHRIDIVYLWKNLAQGKIVEGKYTEGEIFAVVALFFALKCEEEISNDLKGQVYYSLGTAQLFLNKYDRAETALTNSVKLDPSITLSWYNLGCAQYHQNKFVEAETPFVKAAEMDPENSEFMYNLGNIRFKLGKYGNALDAYKKACELAPENDCYKREYVNTLLNIGSDSFVTRADAFKVLWCQSLLMENTQDYFGLVAAGQTVSEFAKFQESERDYLVGFFDSCRAMNLKEDEVDAKLRDCVVANLAGAITGVSDRNKNSCVANILMEVIEKFYPQVMGSQEYKNLELKLKGSSLIYEPQKFLYLFYKNSFEQGRPLWDLCNPWKLHLLEYYTGLSCAAGMVSETQWQKVTLISGQGIVAKDYFATFAKEMVFVRTGATLESFAS
ncbi:MAG: tetratricopeptide repeat protein [Rickettsiales bacterium]